MSFGDVLGLPVLHRLTVKTKATPAGETNTAFQASTLATTAEILPAREIVYTQVNIQGDSFHSTEIIFSTANMAANDIFGIITERTFFIAAIIVLFEK
jgi:hypothetical protein